MVQWELTGCTVSRRLGEGASGLAGRIRQCNCDCQVTQRLTVAVCKKPCKHSIVSFPLLSSSSALDIADGVASLLLLAMLLLLLLILLLLLLPVTLQGCVNALDV